LDSNSEIFKVELAKSKDKQVLMTTMMDALLTMFPSANFVRTDINTNFGFVIGEFTIYILLIYFCKKLCILKSCHLVILVIMVTVNRN